VVADSLTGQDGRVATICQTMPDGCAITSGKTGVQNNGTRF
jgi:hypothetical protein